MPEELKDLFGEETVSYDEFMKRAEEKGMKLVNLKSGGYVDKAKYDKLAGDFTKYKTENDVSKYSDYESIKQELENLKSEKAEAELMKDVADAKVGEKFQKFVLSEVKPLVTEKKDFKSCLTDYLKDNPQFIENPQSQNVFQRGSQVQLTGGDGGGEKTTNKKMNDLLRGARNK